MPNKDFFQKRYEEIGGKLENIELKKAIRVNTLRTSSEYLIKRLQGQRIKLEKIPYLLNGYYADAPFALGAVPEYLLGYYYIQEAASQIPAEVLMPTEKDRVLDMCAAPGSKTTQLSALMNNKGLLVAIDSSGERIEALKSNLERMGVKNVIAYCMDALQSQEIGIRYTKVLLDAPCSGNYVTDANWFGKRSLDGIKKNAGLQKKLLAVGATVLEKGGTLVYSTCSLEPEENEENTEFAVDKLGLRLSAISTIGDSIIPKTKRLWPFKTNTQGFFIAKFVK